MRKKKPRAFSPRSFIVGVGSILRRDDGIGMRVVDELEKENLPGDVRLHGADISGLDLLKFFPDHGRAIIIDAADMACEPGTIKVFNARDIKKSGFKDTFSTHGMALLETLTLAEELSLKCDIIIVGIQPWDTSFGLELTPQMERKVAAIVETVRGLISGY